jgi:hypothetical protein
MGFLMYSNLDDVEDFFANLANMGFEFTFDFKICCTEYNAVLQRAQVWTN